MAPLLLPMPLLLQLLLHPCPLVARAPSATCLGEVWVWEVWVWEEFHHYPLVTLVGCSSRPPPPFFPPLLLPLLVVFVVGVVGD